MADRPWPLTILRRRAHGAADEIVSYSVTRGNIPPEPTGREGELYLPASWVMSQLNERADSLYRLGLGRDAEVTREAALFLHDELPQREDLSDQPLLAAIHRDELLAEALRRRYLDPLLETRDEGRPIIEALRAYFAAGENASVAAAALDVNRRTVASRLERAEDLYGCSLAERSAEIQAALMVETDT